MAGCIGQIGSSLGPYGNVIGRKNGVGGQTARIEIDRISDGRGRNSRTTLKVDSMERKGHVDAEMSGVREFEDTQSGWAQAQAIMTRRHHVRQMDL